MIKPDQERKDLGNMITVSDTAKMLGVTRARVLQFINEQRLRATKVAPKLYLLDVGDVRQFSRIPRNPGRKTKNSD